MVVAATPEVGPQGAEAPVAPELEAEAVPVRVARVGAPQAPVAHAEVQAAVAERLTKSKTQRQLAWDSRSLRIPG